MCLAVPGKVIEIRDNTQLGPTGRNALVDFQGTRREVSLIATPEAGPGDWILVHAGLALQVLDEQEARETWKYLKEAELVDDLPAI